MCFKLSSRQESNVHRVIVSNLLLVHCPLARGILGPMAVFWPDICPPPLHINTGRSIRSGPPFPTTVSYLSSSTDMPMHLSLPFKVRGFRSSRSPSPSPSQPPPTPSQSSPSKGKLEELLMADAKDAIFTDAPPSYDAVQKREDGDTKSVFKDLSSPVEATPEAMDLELLRKYDTVILVDDSGSMAFPCTDGQPKVLKNSRWAAVSNNYFTRYSFSP